MADFLVSKDHIWVRQEADHTVRCGITRFAHEELGEVVYLELPEPGRKITRDEGICAFDSLKSSSEIYSPVSGEIVSVNSTLPSRLEVLNSEPEGEGWLFTVKLKDPEELKDLMDGSQYAEFTKN